MVSDNTGIRVGWLAGRYPGRIGHLFSPWKVAGPFDFCRYAFDNGRFRIYNQGGEWSMDSWIKMLDWGKLSGQRPLWALVPDVVANREKTLEHWLEFAPILRGYGWPLAFAVQDGMVASDVPKDADVIFVGGSTELEVEHV